ncbi:hypothetical protein D3C81_193210 [compost metagenome]
MSTALKAVENPKPNYKRLMCGGHLCRTQAAYRDLVKREHKEEGEPLDYPTNYPKKYPCVVWTYFDRWGDMGVRWMCLENYKDKLLAQYKEVQGE